jgi:subtilisin family serine protease
MEPRTVSLRPTAIAAAALLCTALAAGWMPVQAAPAGQNSDSTAARPSQDTGYALVQLAGDSLATSVKTRPAKGKKIDFNNSAVKSYRAQLSALRNDYKAWLRSNVPGAQVTGEFDISLNAVAVKLNGATLAQVSNTSMVKLAQYQGLYYPNAVDPDLNLIEAPAAWTQAGGAANAGEGVKVAIIDTGVDFAHPCFSDAGYPAQTQLGDKRFTNNKVIVAKVFNNKTPSRGYTAEAIGAHGSHVAGTVACNANTPATVDGVSIPYGISGVAPRALLGSYNIFPNDIANARSEDILNALEAAYADGMDVANMSLGGGAHGVQDLLTVAVDNLDQANMVVAVANGNEGPGYRTVGSPGSAARALSAGASSVGHSLVSILNVNGTSYEGVKGEFGSVPAGGLSAPLGVVSDPASPFGGLSDACSPLPGSSLAGKIALISRGTCDFTVKLLNAQNAGAVGAIVVNRTDGDPSVMGQNGDATEPTIPAFMVALSARGALMAAGGQLASLPDKSTYVYKPSRNDIVADFTSWGPTDVDFRVKPDVMAPGVNVLSSIPQRFCGGAPCFAFYNGTSMATPHLAGSAAIVRQQHPAWSAADVRSAIVNTALTGVVKNPDGSIVTDVNIVGAGREDLLSAVNAKVTLDPVSLSFGAVPSGSGQTRSLAITLTNVSGASQTYSFAITSPSGAGVSYSVSTPSLTLAAGASGTVTVNAAEAAGASTGGKQATLQISAGGAPVAHAVLYTLVK